VQFLPEISEASMVIYIAENRRKCPNCGRNIHGEGSHFNKERKVCSGLGGCGLHFIVKGDGGDRGISKQSEQTAIYETRRGHTYWKAVKDSKDRLQEHLESGGIWG
jgi:hypothetical protein